MEELKISNTILNAEVAGIIFPNPVILASGVLGITASLAKRVEAAGAGGIVLKTFSVNPRKGYNNPVITSSPSGLINALGIPNPGYEEMCREIELMKDIKIPIIASIMGDSPDSYSYLAGLIEDTGVDALELNVSCPHVKHSGSEIGEQPNVLKNVVEAVTSNVKIPVFVKLTPNVTSIVDEALAAVEGGADALVAINTVKAMAINVETRMPLLSNITGGLSGPAVKPIGLRCVYELYEQTEVPIVGVGGIMDWRDTLEYILAGASCVQVGSGLSVKGLTIFNEITKDLSSYMMNEKISSITDFVGQAHTNKIKY